MPERFASMVDKRIVSTDCPPILFENETKYPGVKVRSRGRILPAGAARSVTCPKNRKECPWPSYYGYATALSACAWFPNPDFDGEAAAKTGILTSLL